MFTFCSLPLYYNCFNPLSRHKTRSRYFITEISVSAVLLYTLSNLSQVQHNESKSGVSSSLTSSLPQTKDQLIWLNVIIVREKLLLLMNNKNPPSSLQHLLPFLSPFVVEKTEMSYNLTLLCISGIRARNNTINNPHVYLSMSLLRLIHCTGCGWYYDDGGDDCILIHV